MKIAKMYGIPRLVSSREFTTSGKLLFHSGKARAANAADQKPHSQPN